MYRILDNKTSTPIPNSALSSGTARWENKRDAARIVRQLRRAGHDVRVYDDEAEPWAEEPKS